MCGLTGFLDPTHLTRADQLKDVISKMTACLFVLVLRGTLTDVNQNLKLRASVVNFLSRNKNEFNVRVTFQRVMLEYAWKGYQIRSQARP